MIEITRAQLDEFAARPSNAARAAIWDGYVDAMVEHGPDLCVEFDLDTGLEWQHFVAQIAHESGGFTILWEDMKNYRPARILQIFGVGHHSAKVTQAEAMKLSGNAEALAERVYGLGNPSKARELGNTHPGDGFKYRGFGLIQVTGRADHERYFEGDYSPFGALRAAFREWSRKGCNKWAARDDIERVTKLINGGHNGIDERRAYLRKAKRIWSHLQTEEEHREEQDDNLLLTPTIIADVQRRLNELGYRPGVADGEWGELSRKALLAFEDTNGLTKRGTLTAESVARLMATDAKPMPISEERRNLTADELRERGSTEIAEANAIKSVAVKVGGGTVGGVILDAATDGAVLETGLQTVDKVHQTVTKVDPTGKLMASLLTPRVLIVIVIAAAAYGLWRYASHVQARRVARARSGQDVSR